MTGLQILTGDCRAILPTLEAGSVQTCITSPPYWGLRDYGTAQWEGGEEGCDHLETNGYRQDGGRVNVNGFHGSSKSNLAEKSYKDDCPKCGARRIDSQLGLEATPQEYIANMVAVFREVWRVLRKTFPEEVPKLCILAGSKPGDTILDPFGGSGTVGQVALELGRKAILIELNPAYIELAKDRTFVAPGFW